MTVQQTQLGIFFVTYETVEMLKKRAERLEQQRAELLEALKRIKAASSANAYSNVEWIAHHANEAITKAEAAE